MKVIKRRKEPKTSGSNRINSKPTDINSGISMITLHENVINTPSKTIKLSESILE